MKRSWFKMSIFKNLPPVITNRLIPRNFGSIGHLPGSKLIDRGDKIVGDPDKFTVKQRRPSDLVIITEKLDGMNSGVVKIDGRLYPVNRKGYDVRTMGETHTELKELGREWARWVNYFYNLYDRILDDGERLVFENCMFTHTLKYNFSNCVPVFLLAKYNKDNIRMDYTSLTKMANSYNIEQPKLISFGSADPIIVVKSNQEHFSMLRGDFEGVVYNYESSGRHEACAKFVSNPLMGTNKSLPTQRNNYSEISLD